MEITWSPVGQRDAAHAGRIAAREHAHLATAKRMHWPPRRSAARRPVSVQMCDADDGLARRSSFMAILPAVDVDEVGQLVAPDGAAGGGEHHVEVAPMSLSSSGSGRMVVMRLARLERQEVDERLAARLRRRQRQAPDLQLVDLAAARRRTASAHGSRRRTVATTKSSSRVAMPARPLPPRRCAR